MPSAIRPDQRRHVALLVDEFHALPAANYEAFLAELAKYGASLVLATQSLGGLDEVDPGRGLRHAVFANVDHVFAFNCSAEDAALLAPELGAPVQPADLVELGDHQCYTRLSDRGERLPAFHLQLDVPPEGDAAVAETLAACSAVTYGRVYAIVAADRTALLRQIDARDDDQSAEGHTGRANVDPENGRLASTTQKRARNEGRDRSRTQRSSEKQQRLSVELANRLKPAATP